MNAVHFENVSKRFLRNDRVFFKKDFFWSVRNLSFSVAPGEAVAIIGPNGAGKTTVMRLAAGILRPTEGVVSVEGVVVPLIAMEGCLFPFLNAVENIRLLLSLYGVPFRSSRFLRDKIIDFAGLSDFTEMQVRKFSNGMRSRLSFSIAAHVPMDVLLFDEVLAAGDLEFRQKCLDQIRRFKSERKAILLSSHRPDEIQKVCDRVLLIERGYLKE